MQYVQAAPAPRRAEAAAPVAPQPKDHSAQAFAPPGSRPRHQLADLVIDAPAQPVLQLMGSNAEGRINKALQDKGEAYTWSDRVGRLSDAEIAEVEKIWTDKGAGKKPPRQIAAGGEMADRLVAILATLRTRTIAYANNFDTKHTADGDVDGATAVQTGNARNNKPPFHTVFKKEYLESLIRGHVGNADNGAATWTRRASDDGDGNVALAGFHVASQTYRSEVLGIYQYVLHYSVVTDAAARTQTITLSHMETA